MSKDAMERFERSLVMDFEKWHDGVGYDLGAVGEMTEAEKEEVVGKMGSRELTWREVEVLEAIGGTRAEGLLRKAAQSADRVTRLRAAEALAGERWGVEEDRKLCREIRGLTEISAGLTATLLAAEGHPSAGVKEALLEAAGKRTESAMHCAALLCFLCGKAKAAFDWEQRPFYLKFVKGVGEEERAAAYRELQERVGMKAKPSVREWLKK